MTKVHVRPEDRSFELVPGLVFSRKAEIRMEDYRGYDIEADLRVTDAGRPEITRLTIEKRDDGAAITGAALRSVAVGTLVREFVKMEIGLSTDIAVGSEVVAFGLLSADRTRYLKSLGPVQETIEAVSHVYRLAEFLGDPPTKAIEDAFGVSRSTAGAWIGRARSAGLIGRRTGIQSGESENGEA